MATLSVSIPDEMKAKMEDLDEVNWSAVARKAFQAKLEEELFRNIVKKSKLTEKDAKEIGDRISRNISKKFLEMK